MSYPNSTLSFLNSVRKLSISQQQSAGASAGTNFQFRAQEVEASSDIGGWDACLHELLGFM